MEKKIVLKLNAKYYDDVLTGKKPFEIRYDDRQYNVGDYLVMREWNNDKEEYTGRIMILRITYISTYKQQPGYVVLGIKVYVEDAVPLMIAASAKS